MTTNELMIGDWVYNKHHEKAIRITPFDFFTHGHRGDGTQYIVGLGQCIIGKDLDPIPLTPEILEKNGVAKPKLSLWWRLDSPCRDLWLAQHTDGSWWLYSSGDCDKDENFAEIRCVHELQHALRLCGIDKEIML